MGCCTFCGSVFVAIHSSSAEFLITLEAFASRALKYLSISALLQSKLEARCLIAFLAYFLVSLIAFVVSHARCFVAFEYGPG